VAQAMQHLFCKHEALNSNPSLTKNKETKNKIAKNKDLYTENYTALTKIKIWINGNGILCLIHVHGLRELIWLKCPNNPKQLFRAIE
jgi:hypothetical protein